MAVRKKKTVAKKKSSVMMLSGSGKGAVMTAAMQAKVDSMLAKQKETAPKLSASDYLKISAKGFSFGENFLGESIDVVVLGFSYFNCFFGYDSEFDEDNLTPPVCFSVSDDPLNMTPNEVVKTPEAEACDDCQWSKFNSARKGKGKACKNYIRLAVIHIDELESSGTPKVVYIRVPPGSNKAFADYVNGVSNVMKRLLMQVGTRITSIEMPKAFSVEFEHIGDIQDNDLVESKLMPLAESSQMVLMSEPDLDALDAEVKPPAGKGKKKAVSKKKAAGKPKAKY